MCFDPDSEPPVGSNGEPVQTRRVTLTASDGTLFDTFEATPANPGDTAVVVLPDVRGLFRFYEDLAVRLAEQGHHSVAMDYFGRTAGVGERPDDFDFRPHVDQTTYAGLLADVTATVDVVAANHKRIYMVGFCFGGSNAWHMATAGLGLAGVIGFYGHPDRDRPTGSGTVIEKVPDMECKVLALMAGDDQNITADMVNRFEAAMVASGVEHEVVTYPGAPHSFFDRKQEEYIAESADAWKRMLTFIT
jgi:carboxymethylenebutenolidase